jgi:hypothetical protein
VGNRVNYFDLFGVHNRYYVPQVGVSAEVGFTRCSLRASCKVGVGLLDVDAKAEGATLIRTANGTARQFGGGVLAPPAGAGAAQESGLAIIPELALTADYQLTSWCRARVGYDFLFVSRVVRAGGLPGGLRSSQVPQLSSYDPIVPVNVPALRDESFWAHGLAAGLEIRY